MEGFEENLASRDQFLMDREGPLIHNNDEMGRTFLLL